MKELGVLDESRMDVPKAIRSDSQGAIDLVHNPRISDRSRHIDIQYHYTRERLLTADFSLVYVKSQINIADIYTKALTKDLYNWLSAVIRRQQQEED